MSKHRTFARESSAARWLEREGYHYGGHLHDEGPARGDYDDWDEPDRLVRHLQTTVWVNPTPTYGDGRAMLEPGWPNDMRWTATLLAAED